MQVGGSITYSVLLADMVLRAARWMSLTIFSSKYYGFISVQRGMNHRLRAFFRPSLGNWDISFTYVISYQARKMVGK